ncbi:MAG TPA: FkbM family methyltransferase [Caulobacteraceae bacterium]|jgi:FkbM family methyltransferase|nr:FkbM family methyltransferase [Caulobacteraceae bacterium]
MLRGIVERLVRNRRIKRRLPNGVEIYVSPDSQLKYLRRTFDVDLIQLAAEWVTPESCVWDIGANCGVFAFSCIGARQIVAVEADPFLCNLLIDSAALGGRDVDVVAAAISGSPGLAGFSIAQRGRASNHLSTAGGRSQAGGSRGRLTVPIVTLDDLLTRFSAPSFVKIDVEGAEVGVLQGGRRILEECRPIIYFEADDDTYVACADILKTAGYRIAPGTGMNWIASPA